VKRHLCILLFWIALLPRSSNAEPIYEFVRKIENPQGPVDGLRDEFGISIDRAGNNLLVGAYREDTGAFDTGAAFLFDLDGNLLTTFRNPTPQSGEEFGIEVRGFGDKVIITAPKENSLAEQSGAVYLYESDGTLLQTFMNPTPEAGDRFGSSVAAVGNNILITAKFDNTRGERSGAAYLFDQRGILLQTYFMPDAIGRDVFGNTVATLSDDKFIIGSAASIDGFVEAGCRLRV